MKSSTSAIIDLEVELARAGTICAYVAYFTAEERSRVLRKLGQDPDQWERVEAAVQKTLKEAVRSEQFDRVAAFSGAFASARARLARDRPFLDDVTPEAVGLDPMPASSERPQSSPPAPDRIETDETLPIAFPTLSTPSGAALPFHARAAQQSPVRAEVAERDPAPARSGETAEVDPRMFAQFLVEPPFEAQDAGSLTLEQFASCQAELATWPERGSEILARYGLGSPGAWSAVRRSWERQRAQDKAVERQYAMLVGGYIAYLEHRKDTGLGPPGD